ncbi:MAG TPA: hypothetical protein VNA88_12990 [Candidatus Kapabacteria bacterium]|nr:hypothetical protein [Candidatus Kapabacteria bacterium]
MNIRTHVPSEWRAATLVLILGLLAADVAVAQEYLYIDVPGQVKVGTTEWVVYHSEGYSGTFLFEYSTDGAVWKRIDIVEARDGVSQWLSWTVPNDTSSNAVIRIVSNDTVCAISSPFSIVTRYRPLVEITRAPQILYGGSRAIIEWSLLYAQDFAGRVVVELSLDAGATWRAIDSVVSRSPFDSLSFTVPNDTTSRGMIRLRTDDWASLDTTSSSLKIRWQPAIILLSPNGGEVLAIESTVTILWESRSINGHLTLEYSVDSGAYWFAIEARRNVREGIDSLAWLVPAPPTNGALLRILHEEGTVADTSDGAIRIINPTSDAPDEAHELPSRMDLTDATVIGSARRRAMTAPAGSH